MAHFENIRSAVLAVTLALPALTGMQQAAFATAGPGQAVHINGEGRKICSALSRQSGPYWEAKVRGRFLDTYAGSDRFVIKTCFQTQVACVSYAQNIRHHIQGVEAVHYARCNEK